jgi:hypothetical protein
LGIIQVYLQNRLARTCRSRKIHAPVALCLGRLLERASSRPNSALTTLYRVPRVPRKRGTTADMGHRELRVLLSPERETNREDRRLPHHHVRHHKPPIFQVCALTIPRESSLESWKNHYPIRRHLTHYPSRY